MAAAGSNQARSNPDLRKRIDEARRAVARAKASRRRCPPNW
jgi:K+-transporting ATPase ATPase C chain